MDYESLVSALRQFGVNRALLALDSNSKTLTTGEQNVYIHFSYSACA